MNLKAYTLVTAPETEPVSLALVKTFCRIDGTDDDALLNSFISSARRMCEEYTKRAFITQTYTASIDRFVDCERFTEGMSVGPTPEVFGEVGTIQLSRQPIQSINSIVTFDISNVQSTVAPSVYFLDTATGRVILNQGQLWPVNLRSSAAVLITFKAGYGDDREDVPEPIQEAVLLTASKMYESRGCFELPDSVKAMLAPYMLPEAFGLV